MIEAILLFYLAIYIFFGWVCYKMAKDRGRSPVIGFILGFLFTIFAVIGYLLAGETEERKMEKLRRIAKEIKRMEK